MSKLVMYTYLVILALSATLIWLWVEGIDYMKKNHPNYKGEDFFDEEK